HARARAAMWLLYARHDDAHLSTAQRKSESVRRRNPQRLVRQPVSLHRLPEHRQVRAVRGEEDPVARSKSMSAPAEVIEREKAVAGIGHSRKRKEDPRFLQGQGNFVDDIKLPGMLYGDIVRSPYGHARIKSINADKAKALPGVIAVLTAEDLKPVKLHWMPTLAGDTQMVL